MTEKSIYDEITLTNGIEINGSEFGYIVVIPFWTVTNFQKVNAKSTSTNNFIKLGLNQEGNINFLWFVTHAFSLLI